MVYFAALYALDHFNLQTLVIVARAESPADRLYQSIGFQLAEVQLALWRSDQP
jgi:ABC-type Fe2+-enterobactin transport system substrate-binding protein